MSLITAIQEIAPDLGVRSPSAVFGSSDLQTLALLRAAQAGAKRILKYHDWQVLQTEKTFTTVAAIDQGSASVPTDFERFNGPRPELWNRSQSLRYIGPVSSIVWQRLKIGISGGVIGYWRLLNGKIQIQPQPAAGQTAAYEYISKNFCTSAAQVGQASFLADTDLFRLDEEALKLEIIWRFKYPRGFAAYAEDLSNSERYLERLASDDRGPKAIRPAGPGTIDWPPEPVWDGTIP